MKKIAVFASGNGSNFQAIINAINEKRLDATIKILVCDQPDAYAIERARAAGIGVFLFRGKDFTSKRQYEQEIAAMLKMLEVELIVLAGFMRLIGPTLLNHFENKIVNIHPSLLPNFPGKDAMGQALAAKAKTSGVTVHFVDEGMDTGPIIAQETVNIAENETLESLQKKIHEIEHQLYPAVLQMLISKIREEVK